MLCAATVMTTAVERDVWLGKKLWKTPFAEKRSEKISQTWKILSDNFNIPASPRSACRWSPFRDSISKSSGKIFPSRFALHVEWVLSWRRFSFFRWGKMLSLCYEASRVRRLQQTIIHLDSQLRISCCRSPKYKLSSLGGWSETSCCRL